MPLADELDRLLRRYAVTDERDFAQFLHMCAAAYQSPMTQTLAETLKSSPATAAKVSGLMQQLGASLPFPHAHTPTTHSD